MSMDHEGDSGASSSINHDPLTTLAIIIETQARTIEILTKNNEELTSSNERLARTVEMQSKMLEENKRTPECPTCEQGKSKDADRMPEPDPHSGLTTVASKIADSTCSIYSNSVKMEISEISDEGTQSPHFMPSMEPSLIKEEVMNSPCTVLDEESMNEISTQSNTLDSHGIPTTRSSLINKEVADFNGSLNQDRLQAAISKASATSSIQSEMSEALQKGAFRYLKSWKPHKPQVWEVFSSLLDVMLSDEYIHLFSEERLTYTQAKNSVWIPILSAALPDFTKEKQMHWAKYFAKIVFDKTAFQKFASGVVRVHNDFCRSCKKRKRLTYGSDEDYDSDES